MDIEPHRCFYPKDYARGGWKQGEREPMEAERRAGETGKRPERAVVRGCKRAGVNSAVSEASGCEADQRSEGWFTPALVRAVRTGEVGRFPTMAGMCSLYSDEYGNAAGRSDRGGHK
jgi:hypothetical protein